MDVEIEIPEKSFFKVDEVCELTGVRPYVLRFWEVEFQEISPMISASGEKLYEHKDIELVATIKKLLFDDKLTIEKAKYKVSDFFRQRNGELSAWGDPDSPQFQGEESQIAEKIDSSEQGIVEKASLWQNPETKENSRKFELLKVKIKELLDLTEQV